MVLLRPVADAGQTDFQLLIDVRRFRIVVLISFWLLRSGLLCYDRRQEWQGGRIAPVRGRRAFSSNAG